METQSNPGNEFIVYPDFLLKEKIMELVEQLNGFTYAELKNFLSDNRGQDANFSLFPSRPE